MQYLLSINSPYTARLNDDKLNLLYFDESSVIKDDHATNQPE